MRLTVDTRTATDTASFVPSARAIFSSPPWGLYPVNPNVFDTHLGNNAQFARHPGRRYVAVEYVFIVRRLHLGKSSSAYSIPLERCPGQHQFDLLCAQYRYGVNNIQSRPVGNGRVPAGIALDDPTVW